MPHQAFKKIFATLALALFVSFGLGGIIYTAVAAERRDDDTIPPPDIEPELPDERRDDDIPPVPDPTEPDERHDEDTPPVPDYVNACAELESRTWTNAPSPMAIICPVVRFLNVLVLSAGAVFVIFVFFAAIKYAMSQGDPKALMGSQQTLTTAVIGFFVVIGVYTLLTIIKNVLGLTDILNPFSTLSDNLARLLDKLNISGY